MDEAWEKWLSELEMNNDGYLFTEFDMNSLEEELKGESSVQAELSWESYSSDSNFTAAATNNNMGNNVSSYLQDNNTTGFDSNTCLMQHASSEKPLLSSSMSYNLSFDDSTMVPNVPNKTCQLQGEYSKENPEETENRKSNKGRSTSQTRDHIIAERKRRENLTRLFIALSAIIPGLKKMDKLSVINKAIDYVKYLQNRVEDLEEQSRKMKNKWKMCYKSNKVNVTVSDYFSGTFDASNNHINTFPNVETSTSAKDVIIRVMCYKQKDIVTKLMSRLEAHNLSIVCSNVLPFGNSNLNITIVAKVDHDFSMAVEDLVKILNEDLLKSCNLQQ